MIETTTFLNGTKGLTRNPIGIIALFVSLIYGFACLVLSTSLQNLHEDKERLPLIWFIIIFPVIILGAFIYLVVHHHEKLYSPSDFRGDDSFIHALDKKRIREKQLSEVQKLETAPEKPIEEIQIDKIDVKDDHAKVQDKTTEVSEIPIIEETSADLLKRYSNAETWAAKELSLKYNVLFKTNVSLQTQQGKMELDAMGHDSETVFVADIKYWKSNKSENALKLSIQEFLRQRTKLQKVFTARKEFKLIIVLVFDSLKDVDKSDYLTFVKNIYDDANIEFFQYDELKKLYE